MDKKELLDWKIVSANVPAPGTLMNLAALLPHGWTIQIDMQQGAGGVSLFGPFDELYEPDTGAGIEADMVQAVKFAHFREAEQERAVDGSWRRFVSAMGDDMPPNDRVEGRDAASSRRVPSHDGLCGNGNYNERTDK